jgi:hypothetical protein
MLRRLKAMSLLSMSVSSVLALLLVSSHFSITNFGEKFFYFLDKKARRDRGMGESR